MLLFVFLLNFFLIWTYLMDRMLLSLSITVFEFELSFCLCLSVCLSVCLPLPEWCTSHSCHVECLRLRVIFSHTQIAGMINIKK